MSGRTRLSWVTALTVASLLLAGGALNAFADAHANPGANGRDASTAKVEHQQQKQAEAQNEAKTSKSGSGSQEHGQSSNHAQNDAAKQSNDGESHGQSDAATHENVQSHDDNGNGAMKDRDDDDEDNDQDVDDDEDLVTPPVEVTENVRPGLGCGDENHEHTGPPGNPDQDCPDKFDDD
jgi:hypothetical protein